MAGISCDNVRTDSTLPKWKQNSCTIRHEMAIPDKVIRTASDGQIFECVLNAEMFIPTRSKIPASLVTSVCINSSNKSNFNKKTVNIPSPIRHICSEAKTGGTYCIARWCGNSAKKYPGISLFRIPKDPDRAFLWLTNAEREDLKILSMDILHTKYLCMEHFNEDMFMNSCKKKLVWNALPTHFPKPDYAYRRESKKNLHRRQHKSNIARTAKHIVLSKFPQPIRRRPLKPKPLLAEPSSVAGFNYRPDPCTAEGQESVAVRAPSVSFLTHSSQCIRMEQSTLKEIQSFKMEISDTTVVPQHQMAPQLSVQGNSMMAKSNTKKLAAKCQEPVGHTETANIIGHNNLNETVCLREGMMQIVTSTSDNMSVGNTNSVHHERDHSEPTVGDNNRHVNDKLMSDDSYLNCDVESLCLEHAFRETNERIYPCGYCGEMFLVKSNLVLHQTTYHSDHPVGCELCGKVLYKSRSEFMEHVCERYSDSMRS